MKQLISKSKYTFNPATKKIVLTDYASVALEGLLMVTNLTPPTKPVLYQFNDNTLTATASGNTFTLSYNTTAMGANDDLQIFYDDAALAATNATLLLTNTALAATTENNRTKVSPISGQTGVQSGAGAVDAKTQRFTLASDDPAVVLLKTLPDFNGELYFSPIDFQIAYTSNTTLTATGAPFDIDDTGCLVTKIYYKPLNGNWAVLNNTHNGVSITASSNVITVAGAGTPFVSTDTYVVAVLGQRKSYDSSTDTLKITEQAPISNRYVQDSLVDTTNTAAATTYFPATTGQAMDGYKDLSISGKFITTGTLTMTLEASNDEDTTNADWIQVYGYDNKNDVFINQYVITNTTLTFALLFTSFNYSNYRIKIVDTSSTNTYIIKARKVY